MIAVCTIRQDPHYRREAFCNGLKKAGYRLQEFGRPQGKKDFLIIWNRYGNNELRADHWEAEGGSVLVAENGYIGKDQLGRQLYAVALHGHNGSGWVPIGNEDRFAKLAIQLQPWEQRPTGYSLICGQRGIGSKEMASPANWHYQAQRELSNTQPTKVRLHPGNKPPATKLEDDLAGARACVIWSSSAGVKALTLGIPVMYAAPYWICAGAATRMSNGPLLSDDTARLGAMQRMAWAQWTIDELETGEPFAMFRDSVEQATW